MKEIRDFEEKRRRELREMGLTWDDFKGTVMFAKVGDLQIVLSGEKSLFISYKGEIKYDVMMYNLNANYVDYKILKGVLQNG